MPPWGRELAWVLLVGLFAASFSAYHYFGPPGWEVRQGTSIAPGQFTPALFIAAGRGFVEPVDYASPEIAPFLRREVTTFDPATLPADFPVAAPHPWDQQHRYLYYAAASIWRIFGISWTSMKVLPIALFVVFAMAAYGVFRHAGNRLPAACCTLLFCLLSGAVDIHATVRDFSKGPFFLLGFFLIGCLLRFRLAPLRFWSAAVALGAVAGIGAGFRQDLVMLMPPALIALAWGARPCAAHPTLVRVGGALAALAVFALLGWPVVGAYQGTNTAHDTLMGFSTPVDAGLALFPADYEHIPIQSDTQIHAIQVQAMERGGASEEVGSPGGLRAIDTAGRALVAYLLATYPADALTRGYAAVLWVLTGGVTVTGDPSGEAAWLSALVAAWRLLMGFLVPALLLYAFGARDPLRAVATFAVCAILFGYVSIQFGHRHAFHLTLVPIWLLLFLATVVRRRHAVPDAWAFLITGRAVQRGGALLAVCVVAMTLPLFAARWIQHGQVDALLKRYRAAPTLPVPVIERALGNAWTAFAPLHGAHASGSRYSRVNWPFRAEYLVARFSVAPDPIRIFVKYETDETIADFTFETVLRGDDAVNGEIHFAFPIFENPEDDGGWWSRFGGILLRKQDAGRFLGLHRMREGSQFTFWSNYQIYPEASPVLWARRLSVAGAPVNAWKPPLRVFPTFAPRVHNDTRCQLGSLLDPAGPGIPDLRAALEIDPLDAGLLARLGKALEADGDDASAEGVYRRLIETAPDNFVGYKGLYDLHARVHSPATRLALWREIADAYPGHCHGSLYLARLELEAGDPVAAEAAYRQAEARSPARLRSLQSMESALRSRGYLKELGTN